MMSRYFTNSFVMIVVTGVCLTAQSALAGHGARSAYAAAAAKAEVSTAEIGTDAATEPTVVTHAIQNKVTYSAVQHTPQYDLRRPEVPSGARVTLFANFLGKVQGCVLLNLAGTSTECQVVDWKPESVTIELPKLGLSEPKNASIVVIMPDGRIAKTFRVLFVAQPDVLVHQDTVPQPLPPAPASTSASYAAPGAGGLLMYAGQ
jgi:hypothetical protein